MRKFCQLLDSNRLQDLLNSAHSRTEKKIVLLTFFHDDDDDNDDDDDYYF